MTNRFGIQLAISIMVKRLTITKVKKEIMNKSVLETVVKMYELKLISQSRACELAGISRQHFLELLHSLKIPAIQTTVEELEKEVKSYPKL